MDPVEDAQQPPTDPLLSGEPKIPEGANMSKALQMVFNPDRDKFPNKCYYEDGNTDMYTKQAQQKRKQLMTDPTV
jgi:hypothetical protein